MRGHAVTLGLVAFSSLLYGAMSLYFIKANKRRGAGMEDQRVEGMSEAEIAEMGDDSPQFRYTI